MTWGDWYFVGAWLLIAGSGIWASATGAPTWVFVVLSTACVVHLVVVVADNRWAALRALHMAVTRALARIQTRSAAEHFDAATDSVRQLTEFLDEVEAGSRNPSVSPDVTSGALGKLSVRVDEAGSRFGKEAARLEWMAASFRKLEGDVAVASARIKRLVAASEGGEG